MALFPRPATTSRQDVTDCVGVRGASRPPADPMSVATQPGLSATKTKPSSASSAAYEALVRHRPARARAERKNREKTLGLRTKTRTAMLSAALEMR